MKNLYLSLFITCLTITNFSISASAVDIMNGESIFTANCSACHAGGNNVIMIDKTLKKEALFENHMDSVGAITYQVTNGKNAMPAFGGRLTDEDIADVAGFVLSRSDKGW